MKAIIATIGLMSLAPGVPFTGPSGLLTSLQSRLDTDFQGTYLAERVSEWFAPTEEELEQASEHVYGIWGDCWIAEDEDEARRLEQLKAYQAFEPPPAVLRGTYSADWSHRKSERLVADWPHWRMSVFERSSDDTDVALHRVFDSNGLTEWSMHSGVASPTTRHTVVDEEEMTRGFLYDYVQFTTWASVLVALAQEQGGVSEVGGSLIFEASLRSLSVLEVFGAMRPNKGYFEYPGSARGTYSTDDAGSSLEMEWFDCSGGLVLKHRLVWDDVRNAPQTLSEDVFLPGLGTLIQSINVSIVATEMEAPLEWTPRDGEEVVDQRMHYPVVYTITPDRGIPDDAWVASEAEALAVSLGAPSEPQVVAGELGLEETPTLPSALEVTPPIVSLGEQPVGTKRRVRFSIRNVGSETVQLGAPEADCGCLEPRIGAMALAPGESTWITAVQEVQSVGPRSVQLRVPVDDGAREGLVLSVEMEGTAAPLLFPSQLYFSRRDTHADGVHARLGFVSRDSLAAGEEPALSVSGDLVGDFQLSFDESKDTWTVTGMLEPVEDDLFGALEATVVAASLSSGQESAAQVLVDRQPEGTSDDWPSGRLSLRMDAGLAQSSLRFPDTHLDGWQVLEASSDVDVHAELHQEDGNGVIELFLVAPDDGARELITCDLELFSSRGRIRLHVIAVAGT